MYPLSNFMIMTSLWPKDCGKWVHLPQPCWIFPSSWLTMLCNAQFPLLGLFGGGFLKQQSWSVQCSERETWVVHRKRSDLGWCKRMYFCGWGQSLRDFQGSPTMVYFGCQTVHHPELSVTRPAQYLLCCPAAIPLGWSDLDFSPLPT